MRLGGYAVLPRMLDKGRALVVGKQGEYCYACPTDQHFLEFTGINSEALKRQLAAGKGDGEILEWIRKNAKHRRSAAEIAAWSAWMDNRAPSDLEGREFFQEVHGKIGPKRDDICTWFDMLDLDDYVSFGGQS